jgi:hypothetical protein
MVFVLLLWFASRCADVLPGSRAAAVVIAQPLTVIFRKSLLVLIFVTLGDLESTM